MGTKVSARTALTGANLAVADLIPVVDTDVATSKKITVQEFLTGILGSTSKTGATETTSKPLLDLAQTWNAGGTTFTSIKMNVTDTASASGSLIQDWQLGGASIASVTKTAMNIGNAAGFYSTPVLNLRIGSGGCYIGVNGTSVVKIQNGAPTFKDGIQLLTGAVTGATDTTLSRVAAGILGIRGANTTTGGVLSFIEQTAPSAPAADGCYIYAQDNGGGKTQLMALFASGAAQQIAIEP